MKLSLKPPQEFTKYLIAFTPRSGSTYLCSLLASHPQVVCHYEFMNKDLDYRLNGTEPEEYLERWVFHRPDIEIAAAGGKFSLYRKFESNKAMTRVLLADQSVKCILIRRRNTLRQALSNLWREHRREQGISKRIPVTEGLDVNPKTLRSKMRWIAERDEVLASKFQYHERLFTDYEDLLDNPSEHERLLEFLGVGYLPLRSHLTRLNTLPIREAITNFDEVAEALAGTQWAPCLEME